MTRISVILFLIFGLSFGTSATAAPIAHSHCADSMWHLTSTDRYNGVGTVLGLAEVDVVADGDMIHFTSGDLTGEMLFVPTGTDVPQDYAGHWKQIDRHHVIFKDIVLFVVELDSTPGDHIGFAAIPLIDGTCTAVGAVTTSDITTFQGFDANIIAEEPAE